VARKRRTIRVRTYEVRGNTYILLPWTFFVGSNYGKDIIKRKRLGCVIIGPRLNKKPTEKLVWWWLKEKSMPLFWAEEEQFGGYKKREYTWERLE
jgi:hypothetical protein